MKKASPNRTYPFTRLALVFCVLAALAVSFWRCGPWSWGRNQNQAYEVAPEKVENCVRSAIENNRVALR